MTGPSSEVRLDIPLARRAVEQLRAVRKELDSLCRDAADLARTTPVTAHDLISLEAFELLRAKADGGPGSLRAALEAGVAHVDALIRQMEADIVRQEENDRDRAQEFGRSQLDGAVRPGTGTDRL